MAVSKELLRRFSILQPLSEEALEVLATQSTLQKFARRGVVINAGQQEDHLCFLFEGRLQGVDFTLDGREVGLYFVEPGDFCGELGLFDREGQPESVIALTRSTAIFIPSNGVRAVLEQSYPLVEKMYTRMASRVRQLSAQRALLGLSSTTSRVCGQLWMLLERQQDNQDTILNPPTHQEIGIMLNLSRETVTRVFQTLQTKKIVKRDGASRLQICDPETLKQMAEATD